MPHPEGQHSAHGAETSTRTDASAGYYFDNLSWKTLSTITRVMPDVMKIGLLCYVLPKPWSPPPVATELDDDSRPAVDRYAHLFSAKSKASSDVHRVAELPWPESPTDISERWEVRPVSMMVRRQIVNNTKYRLVKDLQQRYRAGAKIHVAAAHAQESSDGNPKAKKKKISRDRKATGGEPAESAEINLTLDDNIREADPASSAVVEDSNSNMKDGDEAAGEEDSREVEEKSPQDCSGVGVGIKRTREHQVADLVESAEIKDTSVERDGERPTIGDGDVSKFTSNAFKRTRVRRNIDDIREKSAITKKATIWELLSSPDHEEE
eukprot:gene7381-5312_t